MFLCAGTEPLIFKTKFIGWNDVIAVDFTRTADSVRKTGADLRKWAAEQETKVHHSTFLFLLLTSVNELNKQTRKSMELLVKQF